MIKINLLSPELQGRTAADRALAVPAGPLLGKLLVGVVLVAVVAICAGTGYTFWSQVATVSSEDARLMTQAARMQKEYDRNLAKNQDMKKKWDRMKIQEEILSVLMPDNPLLWSEKLNMLSNLTPAGVYVTQLEVEEATELVETEHSKQIRKEFKEKKEKQEKEADKKSTEKKTGEKEEAGGQEPPVIRKPVIRQTLTIKAVATGKDQNERRARVQAFQESLKNYSAKSHTGAVRRFMDNFAPDVAYGTQEATVYDDMEVWAFEFKLTTQPFGFTPKEKRE